MTRNDQKKSDSDNTDNTGISSSLAGMCIFRERGRKMEKGEYSGELSELPELSESGLESEKSWESYLVINKKVEGGIIK